VVLLYQNIGAAAFATIGLMIAMYPLNNLLANRLLNLSRETNKSRDGRIKLLTEVLHAVRLVKMLAWERHIADLVGQKRDDEMDKIRRFKIFDVINGLVWQGFPTILPLITFGIFVAAGGRLDPGLVFSSLAYLDMIRVPMNLFPQALQILVQVKVGMDRIEGLLLADEVKQSTPAEGAQIRRGMQAAHPLYVRGPAEVVEELVGESTTMASALQTSGPVVSLSGCKFRWTKATSEETNQTPSTRSCLSWWHRRGQGVVSTNAPCQGEPNSDELLAHLSADLLDVPRGKLVIIVGAVGAGKSTLVAGLLNEAPIVTGRVEIQGPVAYCSQVPWILHGTVKENILFGMPFDARRFDEVISKCALEADFKELRDGAETVIGERGINLSGGQKARIGLARAAYTYPSSQLYILDDPLSAVDMHVAKHLMEECIGSTKGLLRHSTRVLVTHQLQYLHAADLVVVVRAGVVAASRPPADFSETELKAFGLSLDAHDSEQGQQTPVSPTPKIGLTRFISGESDAAVLATATGAADGCMSWKEAWPSDSSASNNLNLGASRLHPLNRGRTVPLPLALTRSISEHPYLRHGDNISSDPGALPAEPLSLHRARSLGARDSTSPLDSNAQHGSAPAENGAQEDGAQVQQTENQAPAQDDEEEIEVGALSMRVWCLYARVMGMCTAAVLCIAYVSTNGLN
jgi:ABC-type multidrug transport system fused ATPase/permease subunit